LFASPCDQPAEFWKVVATLVKPHLLRMQELDEHFAHSTGFRYIVDHHAQGTIEHVLPALEKAARTVDERIAKIEPAQLAAIRREGSNGYVQILLRADTFGGGDGTMLPLESADRTFLDIVERNRQAAARGEIVIRD
jgi:G:T/U-mismatch repair DNA glycosylase